MGTDRVPNPRRAVEDKVHELETILHWVDFSGESSKPAASAANSERAPSGDNEHAMEEETRIEHPDEGAGSAVGRATVDPSGQAFMDELARARAQLHAEQKCREAAEVEVSYLTGEVESWKDLFAKAHELLEEIDSRAKREEEELQQRIHELEAAVDRSDETLTSATTELSGAAAQREEEHQRALAAAQSEVTDMRVTLDATLEHLKKERERRTAAERDAQVLFEKNAKQLRELQSVRDDAAKQTTELDATCTQLKAELTTAQDTLAKADSSHQASEQELRAEVADLSSRLAIALADHEQLQEALSQVEDEKESLETSIHDAQSAQTDNARRIEQLNEELANSLRERDELNNSLEAASRDSEQTANELREKVASAQERLVSVQEQLQAAAEELAASNQQLAVEAEARQAADKHAADIEEMSTVLQHKLESLQRIVQREAAARRKVEAVTKLEADDQQLTVLEAEGRIEQLSQQLQASKNVELVLRRRAAQKIQNVESKLAAMQDRIRELEGEGASDSDGPVESPQ